MALAIDGIDRHGPSNEMRCRLQQKKTKGKAVVFYILTIFCCLYISFIYISFIFCCLLYSNKNFAHLSLLTRRSALVLKVSVSYGLIIAKCIASYS